MLESVLEFREDGLSGVLITNPSGQMCRGKRWWEWRSITPVSIAALPVPLPSFIEASSEHLSKVKVEHIQIAQIHTEEQVGQRQQAVQKQFENEIDHLPEGEKDPTHRPVDWVP